MLHRGLEYAVVPSETEVGAMSWFVQLVNQILLALGIGILEFGNYHPTRIFATWFGSLIFMEGGCTILTAGARIYMRRVCKVPSTETKSIATNLQQNPPRDI